MKSELNINPFKVTFSLEGENNPNKLYEMLGLRYFNLRAGGIAQW
jgi:hypothetical protein